MKVDHPHAQFGAEVTKVANDASAPARRPGASVQGDTVKLSSDLRLAEEAVRAAAVTEEVRPEAVAKARALIARGEVGTDLERLADRLIDSLLDSHDESS